MRFMSPVPRSCLFALLLASAPLQAQWCQDPNGGAYWCGDPSDCVGVCGEPGSSCITQCTDFGSPTTCGERQGHPANDLDSDGIGNSTDNCVCTANSSQANCDGDSAGNACDAINASYVYSHDELCMVDRDTHFGYFELERHLDRVFVDTSSCGAPNMYETYEEGDSAWCYNTSTYDCCRYVLEESDWWCNRVGQNFCRGN